MYVCEQVDPESVFSQSPCPLSQPVLLSLIQQLSVDLTVNTELKHKWVLIVTSLMLTQEDGKTFSCDNAILAGKLGSRGFYLLVLVWYTLNVTVFWFLQNFCSEEGDVWWKRFSNIFIVTLVTQRLPSSFLCLPCVLMRKLTIWSKDGVSARSNVLRLYRLRSNETVRLCKRGIQTSVMASEHSWTTKTIVFNYLQITAFWWEFLI